MVRIRVADESDAGGIARVHVASWRSAYAGIMPDEVLANLDVDARARDWTGELRRGAGTAIIAIRDDDVLGFCYFSKCLDSAAGEKIGEIQAIYVDPACWRSGIGRQLLDESLSRLHGMGFGRVILWVLADNVSARRFYRVNGFREDGAQKEHANTGLVKVRYERAIP